MARRVGFALLLVVVAVLVVDGGRGHGAIPSASHRHQAHAAPAGANDSQLRASTGRPEIDLLEARGNRSTDASWDVHGVAVGSGADGALRSRRAPRPGRRDEQERGRVRAVGSRAPPVLAI